jgi:hypothetical protein
MIKYEDSTSKIYIRILDESWDHAVWYFSIEATTNKKKKTPMLIYVIKKITILNIALINVNFTMIVNKQKENCKIDT